MTNFEGLGRSEIRELQLQARPFHWLEFRDVPLQPDPAAPKSTFALPVRNNVVIASGGRAKLPSGATVELISVADPYAKKKIAWRPDRSSLGQLPPLGSSPEPELPAAGSRQVRELRYRCTFPGEEVATTMWEFSGGGRDGQRTMAYEGLQQNGLSTLKADTTLLMERPRREVTARLGLATGPFKNVLRASLQGAAKHTLPSGETVTVEAGFPRSPSSNATAPPPVSCCMRRPA